MKILCVGGCVFDILVISDRLPLINYNNKKYFALEYGSKIPGDVFIANEGGSATNIALNLKKLGMDVSLLATIGDDFLGDFIIENIKKTGMSTEGIIRIKNTYTGTAFIVKNKNSYDRSMITVKGASDLLNINLIDKNFIEQFNILVWCSLTSKSGIETINFLIEYFNKKNRLIVAAPSSSMIRKFPDKTLKMIKKSHIFSSNLEEAQNLLKNENITWEQAVDSFYEYGLDLVSITNGPEGAILKNNNYKIRIIPPKTKIVDTTGVGDAFLSGLIYGLVKNKPLPIAGKIATLMALCVLQDYGTRRGAPTVDKLNALFPEIENKIKIIKL